jgi:oxygen-dependent protoporphyrinogen oxidase
LTKPAPQQAVTTKRIVVIGGGIAGLAATFHFKQEASRRKLGLDVVLLEGSSRFGGPLHTIRKDGFVIETGADSFITDKPWGLILAKRLGLESALIGTQPQYRKTYVVSHGRLLPIPEGFALLAPTYLGPVLSSPIFSLRGKLRMALEPLIPRRRSTNDESLGSFVTRRLGREVLERVAQPLAAGIYTADPRLLSMRATLPRFVDLEQRFGSVTVGLRRAASSSSNGRAESGARWSLFASFAAGIETLVEKLLDNIGGKARSQASVERLEQPGRGRWTAVLAGGETITADGILLATPARTSAKLLLSHHPQLADRLGQIQYSSAATVNLAYRTEDFPRLPDGFGFVVPLIERRRIIAGSLSSLKFTGRSLPGTVLMRAFIGGSLQAELMALGDAELAACARDEFRSLLGVASEPIMTYVERWPNSMPQYRVGHLDLIDEIEAMGRRLESIELAGAAFRGVGIPDCIRSGELAADRMIDKLLRGGTRN